MDDLVDSTDRFYSNRTKKNLLIEKLNLAVSNANLSSGEEARWLFAIGGVFGEHDGVFWTSPIGLAVKTLDLRNPTCRCSLKENEFHNVEHSI